MLLLEGTIMETRSQELLMQSLPLNFRGICTWHFYYFYYFCFHFMYFYLFMAKYTYLPTYLPNKKREQSKEREVTDYRQKHFQQFFFHVCSLVSSLDTLLSLFVVHLKKKRTLSYRVNTK